MREKDLEVGLLLDFYGELLSDSRRQAAQLYYDEDLSLAEIADLVGITRQGVRDSIAKAREQLYDFESKLGLAERFREMSGTLKELTGELEALRGVCGEPEKLDAVIRRIKAITI